MPGFIRDWNKSLSFFGSQIIHVWKIPGFIRDWNLQNSLQQCLLHHKVWKMPGFIRDWNLILCHLIITFKYWSERYPDLYGIETISESLLTTFSASRLKDTRIYTGLKLYFRHEIPNRFFGLKDARIYTGLKPVMNILHLHLFHLVWKMPGFIRDWNSPSKFFDRSSISVWKMPGFIRDWNLISFVIIPISLKTWVKIYHKDQE